MKQHITLSGLLLALLVSAAGCQKDVLLTNDQPVNDPLELRAPASSFDLYLLNMKSGETMQLTHILNCGEFDASFSHNSRFVAHDAFFDPGHDIYVTDLLTKESKLLPGAEGGDNASWSPNGKWIAYTWNGRIYRLPWEGGTPEYTTQGDGTDWSPNSKMIVFERNGVYTHNLDTGVETYICEGASPAWSPNGSMIAFIRAQQLFIIPVDENGAACGVSVQLTNCSDLVAKPTWSPNSKMIAFFSGNETDSYDIWQVRVEDGELNNLTKTPDYHEFDPDWSPNGRFIVFSRGPKE